MTTNDDTVRLHGAELSSLYRLLPFGIALLSPELRIVRCNEAFAPPHADTHRGRLLAEVLPALAPTLVPLCLRVVSEGTSIVQQWLKEEGSPSSRLGRTWFASCRRTEDEHGDVLGVSLVLRRALADETSIADQVLDQDRLRLTAEEYGDLICRYRPDTTLTFVNDAYCRFFDRPRATLLGQRFIDLLPPDDRASAMQHIEHLMHGGEARFHEHAVLLPDGSIGRQQWINHAIARDDGAIEELEGIGRDITDKWRAEEALRTKEASLREAYQRISSLAQRLILAQEAERTEIARNLHDDIGQQLAALTIGLSVMEARVSKRPDFASDVAGLRHMVNGLADKIRSTSHALHPGVLRHAGLSAALASHCESVAAQHDIGVLFDADGRFDNVPDAVALCLYRAVQQALRNVVMHADAGHAVVRLQRQGGNISVVVQDNGQGFDPSSAHVQGIGLLSIEERVRFVNGTFRVVSSPGVGTELQIEVPVPTDESGRSG